MTSTPKVLISMQDLPTTNTLLYTSPIGGQGTWIDKARSVNHSVGTATVTVNHVPNGGSVGASDVVTNAQSIGAGQGYDYPELVGRFLGPGDSIEPLASAGGAVNFFMSGRELT